ncbi:MAG: alanine racemase, partial [Candidatus Eisenbacteria bacterium]|nr:alanine racemase [Candidatus Eisenbacteria bacterium]
MNRVTIDLAALQDNILTIDQWMERHGATWTFVSKALCGHEETLRAMSSFGMGSVADSRLENLQIISKAMPNLKRWYLRPPQISNIAEVIALSDVSLNTERAIIRALEEEAARQGKHHQVVVMIELGDLREGILPGGLVGFYEEILRLEHVEVIGIGANLGCISGTVPYVDQFTQLSLYRELLELKFGKKLPVISAGSSAVLPLMLERDLPRAINHFRIGEALFLGTDLIHGGTLAGLRSDAVQLDAEIVEIKQ